MNKLFESLLAIDTLAELKLTLCVLAKATRSGEDCPAVTYVEFQSATRFSSATITKGLTEMQVRGYILRSSPNRRRPTRYQVLWDRLGIPAAGVNTSATPLTYPPQSAIAGISAGGAESYFTATGFLDLLPQARDIARSLGYGEDEMIQAAALVFDKQRTDPPTRNRTKWFMTVFSEKIRAAHAEIQAYREKENRTDRLTSMIGSQKTF